MALLSSFLPPQCCRATMIAPSHFQSGMCFCLSQLSADSKHKCDHQNAHISTFTFLKKDHHFMVKPRERQAVKKQKKPISSDAAQGHSKARHICHEIREHKCKSFLHVNTYLTVMSVRYPGCLEVLRGTGSSSHDKTTSQLSSVNTRATPWGYF